MGTGDTTGGSQQLARLIDEYGEHLIPDLKHYYGIDLRDLFSEDRPISPRFVLAHIRNLDYDSAFVAEVRGGQEFRGWDPDRYLTNRLVDVIRTQSYLFVLANVDPKKKSAVKPPDPSPTPDETTTKKHDKPGSFAFIAKAQLAAAKRRKALGG